ncbi:oxygenase MpaB family protein [Nonomuraea terrae]|nr:oxygenase MpaB family protein [Nonomuraea terrae]
MRGSRICDLRPPLLLQGRRRHGGPRRQDEHLRLRGRGPRRLPPRRLVHRRVRQDPAGARRGAAPAAAVPHWGGDIPISQEDMLVTWHTLPTFAMRKMIEWKVPVRPAEPEAYLHVRQVTAHMLGIKDEYVPATWDAAYAQSDQILPRNMGPTQERRPRVTGARAT